MTRPIDIRDLARRDAELTDARLGLDEDNNLAMTNQPDNSTIGTAASRDVGTDPDQIPLNSDLGSASLVDTGTASGNAPLNSDLGSASLADTGTATGEIPTADDLNMVGASVNFTSNNLNPDVFGGIMAGQIIGATIFPANGVFDFTLDILSNTTPVSITATSSFDVYDILGVPQNSGLSVVLQSNSSNRKAVINVQGTSGLTVGDTYTIRTSTTTSKIKVNF